jgi:energy-coupling factor transporter ATP-binding protein EcfA2
MIKVTDLAKSYGGNVLFQDLNFTINRGERVGLVGRNGSGKTYFAGSAPDVLFLAVEDGTLTLKKRFSHAKKVLVKDFDTFEKVYWYLKEGKHPFKTVVIDTISRFVQVALRNELEESGKVVKEVITLTQKNYGDMTQRVIYWLTALFDLPMNVIVLSQERASSEDAEVADFQGFPDMPRALRNFLMGDMDIVARVYIGSDDTGTPQFRMMVGPNANYTTKDRVGFRQGDFKTPTFEQVLAKFKEAE